MKILFSTFLLLLFIPFGHAQDKGLFIVHEWGTFTTLQSSNGQMLSGLYTDEEELPLFVDQISPNYTVLGSDKGWHPAYTTLKNVTVKMETPVIYFYSDVERNVRVDVQFKQGSISQWYPSRSAGEFYGLKYEIDVVDFAKPITGWIQWDGTVLAPDDNSNYTSDPADETPQWVRPRDTKSNLVKGIDGEIEKFLFYRGIGNFEVALKVEFNSDGNLVLTNNGEEKLCYVMVYEKKDGQQAKVWWSGGIDEKCHKVVLKPSSLTGKKEVLQGEMKQFEGHLISAGLYEEEAKAMLNTWRESYFEREGLKIFWIVPPAFTDEILPIQILPAPDVLNRVLVGRSEILTRELERELIRDYYVDNSEYHPYFKSKWSNDRFYHAYVDLCKNGITTSWTSINSSCPNTGRECEVPVIETTPQKVKNRDLIITPNPFDHSFTVSSYFEESPVIYVTVRNLFGKEILNLQESTEGNFFQKELILDALPAGIYLLNLSSRSTMWSAKIIKLP